MPVPAGRVRLPDLDDRIRHRIPRAVPDQSFDDDVHAIGGLGRNEIAVTDLEAEIEERPDGLEGGHDRHSQGLHGRAARTPEHDVEGEAEGPFGLGQIHREPGNQPVAGALVGDRVEDRIVRAAAGRPGNTSA